ncbi:hypothetical protein Ddye_011471 [Dipteronia dyeriana]|uniref:S-protein homolog n=1 Tax=Dipteronia dyeriana TaxID=168575 RepID=A0AAD9X2K4_9ROSI|nr:hypothetical protein Ddye_011471 [Dipteronia dyeriana]
MYMNNNIDFYSKMGTGLTVKSFLVILVMTSICKITMVAGWIWDDKNTIVIQNGFHSDAYSLYVHCLSSDDDIGEHWLGVGQTIAWSFHVTVTDSTLFHCYAQWDKMKKYFNAIEWEGQTGKCCADKGRVTWVLQEDGLHAIVDDDFRNVHNQEIAKLNWD